jgi:hypothetical protein
MMAVARAPLLAMADVEENFFTVLYEECNGKAGGLSWGSGLWER